MLIRPFHIGEELQLRVLFHDSVHQLAARHYTAQQLEAWAPTEFDEQAWCDRIRRNQPFVVEDAAHRLLGYADLQADGYIDQFFIAGGAARRGVGTALLAFLEARARQLAIVGLSTDVSLCAEAFFRQAGFQVVERHLPVIGGIALANARMINALG
ncbi:GNAT family N-acetyltransferase [Geopseudomonas aromaticivorans]